MMSLIILDNQEIEDVQDFAALRDIRDVQD
jgi:hypothetical protein